MLKRKVNRLLSVFPGDVSEYSELKICTDEFMLPYLWGHFRNCSCDMNAKPGHEVDLIRSWITILFWKNSVESKLCFSIGWVEFEPGLLTQHQGLTSQILKKNLQMTVKRVTKRNLVSLVVNECFKVRLNVWDKDAKQSWQIIILHLNFVKNTIYLQLTHLTLERFPMCFC